MSLVFARILLRYLSGALVAYGYLDSDTADGIAMDPDLALALGAIIGVSTEAVYAVAVKKGWAT